MNLKGWPVWVSEVAVIRLICITVSWGSFQPEPLLHLNWNSSWPQLKNLLLNCVLNQRLEIPFSLKNCCERALASILNSMPHLHGHSHFCAPHSCLLKFTPHPLFLWLISGRLRILASMFWTCNDYLLKTFPGCLKKHVKISKTEFLIIFWVASDLNSSHLNKPLALYCHLEESSLIFYLFSGLTFNSSPIPIGSTPEYLEFHLYCYLYSYTHYHRHMQ